jgi:ApaG protein
MKNKISISIKTEYQAAQSKDEQYVFVYFVSIRNDGEQAAQLLSRKWLITDADGNKTEVQGEGVIGQQPVIEPNQSYEYNSFSVLKTQVGCMQGSYLMQGEDGKQFEVSIPIFTLAIKGVLQ